jgi:ribosomal protein S18 acetylase RimI-like enzyme
MLGDIELSATPSPEFVTSLAAAKPTLDGKPRLPDAAVRILTGPELVRFAQVLGPDGVALATARGAVVDGWLHLGLVHVRAAARRQGLARAMTDALAGWAVQAGATKAVLQVEQINTPAVALYARLGFRTHHRYRTFVDPS